MRPFRQHLIRYGSPIKEAMARLDQLAADALLFVVDEHDQLAGSLTDGDVRRGFLSGLQLESNVEEFVQKDPKFIYKENYSLEQIIDFRSRNFKIIPVVDKNRSVVNVINFRHVKSYLPVDAVIMAGGRGERLRPITDNTPKPLLKVGDKPIIEHNLSRLIRYGIDDFWISVKYLGHQIERYLGSGAPMNVSIEYIWEDNPLGTIGAAANIDNLKHEYVLVTNSDILTNLDYEDFFLNFLEKEADFSVVTIPYQVSIPYAVLETDNGHIVSFKEKPTYTYYSNGGIYLMKRSVIEKIPKGEFYNATDLMESLVKGKARVVSYPLRGYWLDIGSPQDYQRAQEDIKHIIF